MTQETRSDGRGDSLSLSGMKKREKERRVVRGWRWLKRRLGIEKADERRVKERREQQENK